LTTEKDPYYNGDDKGKDAGEQGKHNTTKNATMTDSPRCGDSTFGNLTKRMGKDVKKVMLDFETCAFCAEGEDAGKFYGCVKWTYEQEKEKKGESKSGGTSKEPKGRKYNEAVKKWGDNHGFRLPK